VFNDLRTVRPKRVAGFFLFATLGVLAASQPLVVCCLLIAFVALTGLARFPLSRSPLRLWQVLVLTALSGYAILNYGFANIAVHVGSFPVILGHTLMFAGLALALPGRGPCVAKALRQPATLSLAGLLLLSVVHLFFDVPRFGLMALRDASLSLESVFILTGSLWGTDERSRNVLMKWLLGVFIVNLCYCYTFPWADSITGRSPKSGIFLLVPVVGEYWETYLYLLAGALFCLWLGRDVLKLPRWVFWSLAVAQVLGLALHQARSMYVGILVVLAMLIFLRQSWRAARLAAVVTGSLAVLVLGVSLGIEVQGRIGPVGPRFLEEHAESLFLVGGSPAVGSIYDRGEWGAEAWGRATASTANFLVGEGYGRPLIDVQTDAGVPIRQPHDTHLSFLARLGLVGFALWVAFNLSIVRGFLRALRSRSAHQDKSYRLVLWLFAFYVLQMITATVQPYLEFSHGSIPFYFFAGFALSLLPTPRPFPLPHPGARSAPTVASVSSPTHRVSP
jgi:hypothetical protein